MPAFSYRAVDAAGRRQRGVLEAGNVAGARRALRERALLPVAVEPSTADAPRPAGLDVRRLFRPRLGARGLATMTRQLSTLIGSGVRIEEALQLVAAQAGSPVASAVLLEMRGAILDGRSLAASLSQHPGVFPEYFRASVAAGEQSGKLADVLAHLANFVENRQRAGQKVQFALIYPAILAGVSVLMMILLMIYVVPDIVRVFVAHGADLPFLTRALIALSDFIVRFGWVVAAALVIGGVALRRWLRDPLNRLALDRTVATRAPFARFSRQINAARFSGTLATLVQSAVPLVEALTAAAAVTPNRHIRAQAQAVAARVREGSSVHGAMREGDAFPTMLIAIVASGESGGRLGPALGRAADELERELEAQVSVLTSLVEPAVLLAMGGLVLLMVLAILMPIVNLNNLVGQ